MNILILGLGSIAKKHIAALRAIGVDARISALRSSRDAEKFEDIQNIYSLDELPSSPDCVIISNPTNLHFASIKQVLPFQCPLFIEKPVVLTEEEAKKLVTLLPGDAVTYVACVLRHHPCLQFVRDHLNGAHKQINEVNAYCGSFMPEWVKGKDWRQSFRFDPAQSGGVHLELIHEMDYVSWLFGKPSFVAHTLRNVSSLKMPAPDYAHYVLGFDSFTATITLNYFRRDAKRTLEIVFEDETWSVDLLKYTIDAGGKRIFSSPLTMPDLYCAQMRYLLDCLKTGKKPMNAAEEACDVLRLSLHE
ncbi:MAG: Gfo/Idh/MocA family oxidoreductase [Candidatus Peribacteraceae bacterium]|jgi:predicted dehydrogenase|nr:Gfo/Idh/MocA family oxidoreductase [Candidatus Peribacteraceae bacterium]